MAVDPSAIIEQQLEYLKSRSEKGLLSEQEVQSFSALVKLRIVLRSKALQNDSSAYDDISTEELKQLLPFL